MTQIIIRKQTKGIVVGRDMWNGKSFGYLENEKIVTVSCKDCRCFLCPTANRKACVCILQYTKDYKVDRVAQSV